MKRVLIADDEEHVCLDLKYILDKEQGVTIIKTCSSGTDALEHISRLKPDILFLDIDMPGLNGIQLGYYLKNLRPQPYIVYVTAYDKFAVDAFKVGAKGYILKPFAEDEVLEQIRLAREYLNTHNPGKSEGQSIPRTKLPVEDNGKYRLVDQHNIVLAYASDRAVYVRVQGEDFLVNFSLSELEHHFRRDSFIRCHRNYIVNISRIKELIPWFNNTCMLVMDDNTNVPVSRAHVKFVKDVLCF